MLVRMSSSREQIVRAEEEDRDSLECYEDSLKDKTTVTAIGKVNQSSKLPKSLSYIHAIGGSASTVYCVYMDLSLNTT